MKKIFAIFMIFSLLLTVGCTEQEPAPQEAVTRPTEVQQVGYRVNAPKARPDYSQGENPTAEQLRATALQGMQDFVSLPWAPDKYYTYKNPYDIVDKQFQFVPEVTFGGLPYTNAHTGLFQWYAYYDEETGIMSYPGDGMAWSADLGSVCADTMMWSWSTVVNSVGGKFNTFTMTPEYGFIPVGGYEKPEITFEGSTDSLQQVLRGTVKTQYLLATIEAVDAESGERLAIALYRKTDTGTDRGCDGFTYDLQKLEGLEAEAGTTVKLIATLATGHTFTIAEIGV